MPTPLAREHVTELHYILPVENMGSILEHGDLVEPPGAKDPAQVGRDGGDPGAAGARHDPWHEPEAAHLREPLHQRAERDAVQAGEGERLGGALPAARLRRCAGPGRRGDRGSERFGRRGAVRSRARRAREHHEGTVFAQYWVHDDPIATQRHRAIVCAEVLVPDLVPTKYIQGVYASCQATADAIARDGFPVTINPYLFFE